MVESRVVVLAPVLRRPHRVGPFLASLAEATDLTEYRVLFLCSPDDVDEVLEVKRQGAEYLVCPPHAPGDYARKINFGYRNTVEPLLFLAADDLRFHAGWLTAARACLTQRVHVVGTNDLGNPRVMAGRHSTHSLLTRQYADEYGTIDERGVVLHEGYPHTFTDDEFVQTAIARRTFVYARDAVVEHLHPHWGKGDMDSVYVMADESLAPGRQLFAERRRLWRMRQPQQVAARRP